MRATARPCAHSALAARPRVGGYPLAGLLAAIVDLSLATGWCRSVARTTTFRSRPGCGRSPARIGACEEAAVSGQAACTLAGLGPATIVAGIGTVVRACSRNLATPRWPAVDAGHGITTIP